MKKILFITAFPPNRKTAGQNYSRELLNSLVNKFTIDLISFTYPNHDIEIKKEIRILKIYSTSKISKFFGWLQFPLLYPLFVFRYRMGLLFFLLKNAGKYDFVYFDFSQVFVYSLFIRKPFKIMMSHDVIFQKIKRNKFNKINPFNLLLFFSEKKILKSANLIMVFSKKDKELIKDLYNLNASVVSFFIDKKIKKLKYEDIKIERKFCFFGAWNRPENSDGLMWFMDNVFPSVEETIKFEIIGPGLENSFFERFNTKERVTYLGFLENPYSKIAESLALIAPIFQGAGVKVKVVESLAVGTSVIGTQIAFEGIDDLGDNSMINCDTVEKFISTINNFFPVDIYDKKNKTKLLFEKSYIQSSFEDILQSTSSVNS